MIRALREFFTLWLERMEHFLDERDRRYEDRFKAQETAVISALAAQKELTLQGLTKSDQKSASDDTRFEEFRNTVLTALNVLQVWQGRRGGVGEEHGINRQQTNWSITILIAAIVGFGGMVVAILTNN